MKKKFLVVLLMSLCAALAFALAGCQQEPEPELEPEATDVGVEYSTDPFYVLLVGNDSRTGTKEANKAAYKDGSGRSDTVMLMRVDPTSHLITIVSIARDTAIYIDGETTKFNEAYRRYGIEGCIDQVEALTTVRPKYYFDVGFVNFEDMVDALGGIPTNVAVDMSLKDIVHGGVVSLNAGEQVLNGPEALVYARVRKIFVNMDSTRQYHDRELIVNMIQKTLDNPESANEYMDILMQFCDTNMTKEELAFYVNDFIEHKDEVSYLSGSGPADGDIDPATNLWLAWRDEDTWAEMMRVVNEGGDPNTVYSSPIG